jgi:hypothetical protein
MLDQQLTVFFSKINIAGEDWLRGISFVCEDNISRFIYI